jgi:hypothetical protein
METEEFNNKGLIQEQHKPFLLRIALATCNLGLKVKDATTYEELREAYDEIEGVIEKMQEEAHSKGIDTQEILG